LNRGTAWSKAAHFNVVAVAQWTADSATAFGIGGALVGGGPLVSGWFHEEGKMTEECIVLFPKWMFQEEFGIANEAAIPIVLPGLVEDAQRKILRKLTTLPHEPQFLLSVLVSAHAPLQNC
jgi:hypothetical protein